MAAITVDVKKGEKSLEALEIPLNGNTIEDLLDSLKTAKNDSNDFLTTLVNQDKDQKTRNHVELEESSEEDSNVTATEDVNKKQKT